MSKTRILCTYKPILVLPKYSCRCHFKKESRLFVHWAFLPVQFDILSLLMLKCVISFRKPYARMPRCSNQQHSLKFFWHNLELSIGLQSLSSESSMGSLGSNTSSDDNMELTRELTVSNLDNEDNSSLDGGDGGSYLVDTAPFDQALWIVLYYGSNMVSWRLPNNYKVYKIC